MDLRSLNNLDSPSRTGTLVVSHADHAAATRGSGSDERVAALGGNPEDFPRFVTSEQFEFDHALDMSRNDVVVSETGPKFIEFNVGAGVGGALEFDIERQLWQDVREQAGLPLFADAPLYGLLARVLREVRIDAGSGRVRALLVSSLTDPGKTARYFALQREALSRFGVDAELVDIGELGDLSTATLKSSVALMQFNEHEMNTSGVSMDQLSDALDRGLIAVPSQSSRLVDSKMTMALLSERAETLGAKNRQLVDAYIPWTRGLKDRASFYGAKSVDLLEFVLRNQDKLIIKSADGYSSEEVYFGVSMAPGAWAGVIESALSDGYYVAQEVVHSVRIPVRVVDSSGETDVVSANSRICPFHIGGRGTGYHVRFNASQTPGPVGRATGGRPGCVMAE